MSARERLERYRLFLYETVSSPAIIITHSLTQYSPWVGANEVEYILELSHSIGRTQIKVVDHPLFVYKSPGTLNVQLGCIYSAYMYCVSRLFQNLNYAFFSSFECFFEIYDLENPQFRIQ